MEMGSNSSTSTTSSDSLNGLKFGQKIYFEDVGIGGPAKSGGGSSGGGLPPPAPAKKGRVGGVFQAVPPRCQVEGCNVDLTDAKAYYSRHKVCGMHSKSGKVIVSGLEQRFCQQCSRFHLLPEFDQGKRSCRRRLAGHNERRRKPPPGSLLATRYGNMTSSIFENNSGSGSFLMDFTAYPRARDEWPPTRTSEQVSVTQPTGFAKFLQNPNPWQSSPGSPSPELRGPTNRTLYPNPGISSGGCFAGVPDSTCALSLLSNQPCDSRNRSSSNLGVNYLLDTHVAHMVQPAVTLAANISNFSSSSWGFKNNEAGTSAFDMHPELGLGQISQPVNNQYTGDLQLPQQTGRQYMDLEHSRAYGSSAQHMHWSL